MTRLEDSWHVTTPKTPDSHTGLRSVSAALDLLECFATERELGVSDIARRMGIAKSTAHRLLTALKSRGFVGQNPETGRYRLGLHIFELGYLAQVRTPLHSAALPICMDLVRRTGLAVALAVPDRADVVFIERLDSLDAGEPTDQSGLRLPAHVSSTGKAVAAWNPALARARAKAGFPVRAASSIRDAGQWEAALLEVRQQGFAVSVDEAYEDVSSLAVPIMDGPRHAGAAVAFLGKAPVLQQRRSLFIQLLQRSAVRIRQVVASRQREGQP